MYAMQHLDEVRQGLVFETENAVTIHEPGRRRITFFKNTRTYEIRMYNNGTEKGVIVTNGPERAPTKAHVERDGGHFNDTCEEAQAPKKGFKESARGIGASVINGSSNNRVTAKQIANEWLGHAKNDLAKKFGEPVCECFGILGVVRFVEGYYLVVVTDAIACGRILFEHEIYTIRGKTLVPLYHPCSNRYTENYYRNVFNQFDIANNFYFSYTYNLADSLQANKMYAHCNQEDGTWLPFDAGVVTQKFRYNFSHARSLGDHYGAAAEGLCLRMIHGYFGQARICLSGRSLILHLIARRSRFYAGTRYRKRGITADGHVANDVETEQILEDVTCTSSVFSFVQVRGSTPVFWAQDATQTIMKKPPLTYPQNDPTFTATRLHIAELLSLYGAPLIMLNLLSDDLATEEGQLSRRYEEVIEALNTELPPVIRMEYINRNIRSAFERGCVRKMVSELIDHVSKELGYFHMRGQSTLNIQTGVLRASCLDCLDRTSVVAMQLGLLIFQKQLTIIGVHVNNGDAPPYDEWKPKTSPHPKSYNEEFGLSQSLDPVLELFKNMFEKLGDDLALQYAGSKTLRKYEGSGGAFSMSLQLVTTIKRRYYSHFADSDRQTLSNIFLGVLKADKHPAPWIMDVDAYIHHERFQCDYANLDWWVIPLMCYFKRIRKLGVCIYRSWFDLFDQQGEYRPWKLMTQLLLCHSTPVLNLGNLKSHIMEIHDPNLCRGLYSTEQDIPNTTFSRIKCQVSGLNHAAGSLEVNSKINSSTVEYTAFEVYHIGNILHITRSDDDEIALVTPAFSGHLGSRVALPSLEYECDLNDFDTGLSPLGFKKPDVTVISLFLEPWRITVPDGRIMFSDIAQIKCREHDLICYQNFVGVPK